MAKVKIVTDLQVSIPTGTQEVGPANVPNGATAIIVHLARCTTLKPTLWPNIQTVIQMFVESSTDNGQTYRQNNGFGSRGGIWIERDGSELQETTFNSPLRPGTDKVKFTVTVINGPLDTLLTVEVL